VKSSAFHTLFTIKPHKCPLSCSQKNFYEIAFNSLFYFIALVLIENLFTLQFMFYKIIILLSQNVERKKTVLFNLLALPFTPMLACYLDFMLLCFFLHSMYFLFLSLCRFNLFHDKTCNIS
jgi:hypothetical protein